MTTIVLRKVTLAMAFLVAVNIRVHSAEEELRHGMVSVDASEKTVLPVGAVSVWQPAGKDLLAVFVALHGIQSNQAWYEPLGRELAERGYALWAYTRPNRVLRSRDKPVADAESWDEWLAQLESVGDAARIPNRPLIALGVSWGARPVLASLALHPQRWSGAVILNPALKTKKDFSFLIRAFFSGAPLSRLGTFAIPLAVDDYTNSNATRDKWLNENLTTRCTNRFFGRTVKLRRQADRRLGELRKPVLALLGEQDALVPEERVKAILTRANNPRLTIETVAKGTHCMLVEQPVDIAAQIQEWLRAASLE